MKEAALRAASTQGGWRLRRPPPCVDSFMDGCVAVAEAEAEAVAVAVAVCTMHIFPVCTMHIFPVCTMLGSPEFWNSWNSEITVIIIS